MSWAVVSKALPGEDNSGDLGFVQTIPGGAVIAVIDGLGHGPEAAKAAERAMFTVRDCAAEALERIMTECHEALKGTRGAVITLVRVDQLQDRLTWFGVGNVEGRIWPADPSHNLLRQAPPLRGGVIGHNLPPLIPSSTSISRGDIVIITTDGVDNSFNEEFRLEGTAQQIADDLMDRYWTAKDDALILVARYLGSS
ncbi:MAG: SpoIIE family protein phosphatase [Actinomycetota bacterium]